MSDRIKAKIGEDLYNKVIAAGIKPDEFDMLEGYIPRARFNEVNGKNSALQSKIESYEKQVLETQTLLKGSEELKGQYSQLQEKYKADLELKDKELLNVVKKSLVKEALIKEGAKHIDLLMGQVNLDTLSVDNNNLIGGQDTINKLKDTYKDLFVQTNVNGTQSGSGSNNNNNNSGKGDLNNPFARFI